MNTVNKLVSVISWLITLLAPLGLIGLSVRLLLTPQYTYLEYQRPGFPADEYGFTTEDRLHWGPYGINYLLNSDGISYLADLRFNDDTPLFSSRELSHMEDVKGVTQGFLQIWYLDLSVLILLGLIAWRAGWSSAFRLGLRRGGWLTLALAATVGLIATLGASGSGDVFWQFFSDFHGLFFKGTTWLFSYSDTLIRLYPLQFWVDTVLYIGLLTAAASLALVFGLRERSK